MAFYRTSDRIGLAMPAYIDGKSINDWNNAIYARDHKRVRETRGKAKDHECVICGVQACDWAYKHGTDKTDPDNYRPMCRLCHQDYDRPYWLKEERRKERERIERTAAYKGWTPERREAQRQKMLDKWSDPKECAKQSERCKRDKPWLARRETRWEGDSG